jgi:hypothetical protein
MAATPNIAIATAMIRNALFMVGSLLEVGHRNPTRFKQMGQAPRASARRHVPAPKLVCNPGWAKLVTRSVAMAIDVFPHEIGQTMAGKLGIGPEYIDVYPQGSGWSASLKAPPPIWSMAKQAAVKNLARQLQAVYSMKKAAG